MMRVGLTMVPRTRVAGADGRMRALGVRSLAIAAPLALLLAGCGASPPLRIASVGTPNPVATAREEETACWTDEQRIEGADSMPQQYSEQPAMRIDSEKTYTGSLQTNKGTIQVELLP